MKINIGVLGNDVLGNILTGILVSGEHGDDCTCVECTARRIAVSDTHGKPPSGTVFAELVKHSIAKLSERGLRGQKALAQTRSKIVELPVRPGFDQVMYQWRVDEFNARVRAIRSLFAMLPEAEQSDLEDKLPSILSWEAALEELERTRNEITAAVLKIKAEPATDSPGQAAVEAASTLGVALAAVVNAARGNGKTDEEITAVIRNFVAVAKDSMREAEASP